MIELHQVSYAYQNQSMMFNFSVAKGEIVTLLGPSGAGKSTLLNIIAGFITPNHGQIILNGKDVTTTPPAKRPVSILFQDNNLFTHLTVEQNLALGISPSMKLTPEQRTNLHHIAKRIGLIDYLDKYPAQLSGGQRQRVAIGRCLLISRPILLLDEPFSSLDPKLKNEMFCLLKEIHAEYQLTIVMVTHQLDDIDISHNRCLVLIDGKIAYDGDFKKIQQYPDVALHLGIASYKINKRWQNNKNDS